MPKDSVEVMLPVSVKIDDGGVLLGRFDDRRADPVPIKDPLAQGPIIEAALAETQHDLRENKKGTSLGSGGGIVLAAYFTWSTAEQGFHNNGDVVEGVVAVGFGVASLLYGIGAARNWWWPTRHLQRRVNNLQKALVAVDEE